MANFISNMSGTEAKRVTPLISVVIPSYNYGRYITQAINSVLAQTYPAIEVIVVDSSTDDTRDRLESYGDRIRCIYQEKQGLSAARNTGIRNATGEWIAFLDADDIWHPRKLEIQMKAAAHHPDVSLVATGNCCDLPGEWSDIIEAAELDWDMVTLDDLMILGRFSPSSVLLRKDCLESDAPFDTTLPHVEDRDLWIRIAARCGILKINAPLMYTRIHGDNMSSDASKVEHYERQVLTRSFANIPRLGRRYLLRRKAFSYASASAAWMYLVAGMPTAALLRIARSFFLWPFPYSRAETRTYFERPKLMLVILARLLRRPLFATCTVTALSK